MDNTQSPTPAPPTARRSRLAVLLAINGVLACAAIAGLLATRAFAQPGAFANRPHGNYLMVSGRATGVSGNLVYIVDTVNRELIALRYQRAGGRLETIGYRNLTSDSAEGAAGR